MEAATLQEIRALKDASVLGKRAPSSSLLNVPSCVQLLQSFHCDQVAQLLLAALEKAGEQVGIVRPVERLTPTMLARISTIRSKDIDQPMEDRIINHRTSGTISSSVSSLHVSSESAILHPIHPQCSNEIECLHGSLKRKAVDELQFSPHPLSPTQAASSCSPCPQVGLFPTLSLSMSLDFKRHKADESMFLPDSAL